MDDTQHGASDRVGQSDDRAQGPGGRWPVSGSGMRGAQKLGGQKSFNPKFARTLSRHPTMTEADFFPSSLIP